MRWGKIHEKIPFFFVILTYLAGFNHTSHIRDETSRSFSGAIRTVYNSRMRGSVIKSFIARSQISCAQTCRRDPLCVSINFELGSLDGGLCELNSYDAQQWLEEEDGFVFSQLAEKVFIQLKFNSGIPVFSDSLLQAISSF